VARVGQLGGEVKLPAATYGPVQTTSDDVQRLDQEQRRAFDVFAQGFSRYGMELVKTETQAAAADLAAGLADIEAGLVRNRYTSTKEIRDAFGGEIPPELRDRVVGKGVDPTGAPHEFDREDIPTWEVAGLLYDRRAAQLLEQASQRVGSSGWRSEFQASARDEILSRKMRLAGLQTQAMDADLRARQTAVVDTFVRAGRFDEAATTVTTSDLFSPAEKEKLAGEVEHARQLQPLEDRLVVGVRSTADVVEAGKLLGLLESGEGFDRLDDKERIDWKRRLEAEVKEFEHIGKEAAANRFREADEAAKNALLDAYMQAGGRQLSMKLVPPPGSVSSGTLQWAIQLVESTRPGAKPTETDLVAYAELSRQAKEDPAAFKDADLSPYFKRLSIPDARHFLELQRTLKAEGPEGPKYTSFVGPQEETNMRLVGHGFHVSGKGAEDDAVAVGYVQREVNRALWKATQEKARAGKGTELNPDEQTAIVVPLVDKLVQGKAWEAGKKSGGLPGVDPVYAQAVHDSALRRGKGVSADAQRRTFVEYQAWENDIATGWKTHGAGRVLTPREALEVFDIIQTQGDAIKKALEDKKKPSGSTAVADMAVRGYLRGVR
jgi:predicted transcriptional regulator